MLDGLMMDYPLTLTHLLERARRYFPRREVVSRLPDGTIHRTSYGEIHARASQLANALARLGVRPGDRVASLSWNHYRHLEAYAAVPAMGAVLHTLNLRLHPSELLYIANHAGDKVVIVDRSLLPLLGEFRDRVASLERVIVVPDDGPAPDGETDYEALIQTEPENFDWPKLDERAAALMCYTSGTTGMPKGVRYSHRSTVLHTLALCLADTKAISEHDVILPVVPMFHANAWGFPFAAFMTGAKLVFPGPDLRPESIAALMAAEKVTFAAAVPTVWLGVLAELDRDPKRYDLGSVRMIGVGGAAAPPSLIDAMWKRHRLAVCHSWGMTETNPLATLCRVKVGLDTNDDAELALRAKQGYAVPFVETRHVDGEGNVLTWDGKQMGELHVRGAWVASDYHGDGEGADKFTSDGWFRTGDVVTIDSEGYIQITDREKDVVKSGGEWISTQALENALMSHPSVLEAAVFAAQDEKWGERPVAAIVLKPGLVATDGELGEHIRDRFAKWWLPDAYLFVDQIPRTSTGKFKKLELRQRFGDCLLRKRV
jgi:fatty-acyl-CoA synthase